DLAEEVPRTQPRSGLPADADLGGAVGDQEEPDAPVSLAGDDVALGVLDLLDRPRDGLELLLRAAGEHGHLREMPRHLSSFHTSSSARSAATDGPAPARPEHDRRILADIIPPPIARPRAAGGERPPTRWPPPARRGRS